MITWKVNITYNSLIAYLFFQEIGGVRLATSKTEGGFIQIVLTDEGNGTNTLQKLSVHCFCY